MPRRVQIPAYLAVEKIDELERIAAEQGVSRNEVLRLAVDTFLSGPRQKVTQLAKDLEDARDRVEELQAKAPDPVEGPRTVTKTAGVTW